MNSNADHSKWEEHFKEGLVKTSEAAGGKGKEEGGRRESSNGDRAFNLSP
jgi:hypothetical protein